MHGGSDAACSSSSSSSSQFFKSLTEPQADHDSRNQDTKTMRNKNDSTDVTSSFTASNKSNLNSSSNSSSSNIDRQISSDPNTKKSTDLTESDFFTVFSGCALPWALARVDGRMCNCNEAFIRISGYSRNELLSFTIFNLINQVDLQDTFRYVIH